MTNRPDDEGPTAPINGPLTGVRIIELAMLVAGPFATRLLADLGADVIKVEAPDRLDPLREWGQRLERGRSLWWPISSRNKRCITLDLRREQGQELLLELVEDSDALVEAFRPGTLERWNLAPERLHQVNPGLVVVRISGYGQTGPYANRPGFAAAAEAMSGLRSVNGYPGMAPPRFGISLGDSLAGMFAAQGLLAALYERHKGPVREGQIVDISILESCFALLEGAVPEYQRLGHVRRPSGARMPGMAPSSVFRSRDGRDVVIAANHDSLFRRLCIAIDRPDLLEDERFATGPQRFAHQDALEAEISVWAAGLDADDIISCLSAAGVVVAPIATISEVVEDAHLRAREMLVEHHDEELGSLLGPGVLPKFSRTPGGVRWSGPGRPGAHNAEVYGGLLGLSTAEQERLTNHGVI